MWNNLLEFSAWYKLNGYPLRPPQKKSIFNTPNSKSLVVYKEGKFQVTLVLNSNKIKDEDTKNIIIIPWDADGKVFLKIEEELSK